MYHGVSGLLHYGKREKRPFSTINSKIYIILMHIFNWDERYKHVFSFHVLKKLQGAKSAFIEGHKVSDV